MRKRNPEQGFEGSFTIPTPKGVYQAAGDANINPEYAYRAENIRTEHGLLATSCGTSRAFPAHRLKRWRDSTGGADRMIRRFL